MTAKSKTPEYERFENALRDVLKVSHSELKFRIDHEKDGKAECPILRSSTAKGGMAPPNFKNTS